MNILARSAQVWSGQRISHKHFLQNSEISSMCFNWDGDLICATDSNRIVLYDWKSEKVHKSCKLTEVETPLKDVSSMNCRNSERSEVDIFFIKEQRDIMRAYIEPSGQITLNTIFRSFRDSGNHLRYTLVPQNRDEIILNISGNIYTVDLRCDPQSNCNHAINWSVKNIEDRKFWAEGIIHHPLNPEICVYGDNCELHVYDKRNYKVAVRKIFLDDEDYSPNFMVQCSYNYNGSEFLTRTRLEGIRIVENNDKGDVIQRFDDLWIEESYYFGPKSTYIISRNLEYINYTSRIYIHDIKTGELVNDAPAVRYVDDYYGELSGQFSKSGPGVYPHPKLPVVAIFGEGTGISIWSC